MADPMRSWDVPTTSSAILADRFRVSGVRPGIAGRSDEDKTTVKAVLDTFILKSRFQELVGVAPAGSSAHHTKSRGSRRTAAS